MAISSRTTTPRPKQGGPPDSLYRDIVGASGRMQRIFRLVGKVAPTDSTVLLLGESGTGKELIARSIHLRSRRASGPFIPVNVAALPESLIDSELFGYARGAFTGATADRAGLIEAADHGTLFLDESSEVRRLGDNAQCVVDVRVIAATHRDLPREVAEGRFREDLYHRLNVVQIDLPSLRERREDIGLLASYFLERASARVGKPGLAFSTEATQLLEGYDYPGNVRELENAIEHAVVVADGPRIRAADLPAAIRSPRLLATGATPAAEAQRGRPPEAGQRSDGAASRAHEDARATWSLAEVEKEHIQRVLARHRGNATAAARQLGLSRTTLWRKLREYGLKRAGGPGSA